MRKLILISALLLTSVSAQAGEVRGLILAGVPTISTAAAAGSAAEAPKPIAQVSDRLAQAATTASDAAPIQISPPAATTAAPVQAQAPAPVQTEAPATTTTTTTSAPATTTSPATTETKAATTETKPKATKKVRRETDEHKARRIAAKYGVYW